MGIRDRQLCVVDRYWPCRELISAILLLFKQTWRTFHQSLCGSHDDLLRHAAGLFPLIHTGRPWLAAYWLFPYPNSMGVWPQFAAADLGRLCGFINVFHGFIILFWAIGLIPDFASMRDSAKTLVVRRIYGMLAMGWRGSARHWNRYERRTCCWPAWPLPLVSLCIAW